jgi:pilus assembly protein CpaF
VFVAKRGRSELTTILAPGELADLVERMLRTSGRRIDMSTPFVDVMMPDGSRLHVVIPMSTRPAATSPYCPDGGADLRRAHPSASSE